ncbi:sugar phosphate isomerase/epimerase [Janibacter sp. HTCC2649]|uniref:sugar phosphate isomerase/epimerase family protein n=1 Tax=Janibacter sp. HTCC2649 TaxID=313589 RepID=UPI001ED9265D|nr:TIM barrel protein [Janibacter sp. HTCC2649]
MSPAEVIDVTRDAGLRRIEWGADVHAPPTDLGRVAEVRELTLAAGLTVASYGSYWRAGVSPLAELTSVVTAASTLCAPRIRVWAGEIGTDVADGSTWDTVVDSLREGCAVARDHGIELALEFHPDTLTDSVDTTLDLLERVGDDALRTYWQPRLDEETGPSVEGLRRLVTVLAGIHVFSWWPGANRLRLHERSELWSAVADCLVRDAEPCDLLLEFVPDDDPTLVAAETATLHDLILATVA